MVNTEEFRKKTSNFMNVYDLNGETHDDRLIIDAKKLLLPQRIDLVSKILYIKSKEMNYKTNYFKKMYKKTIESLSKGLYIEPGSLTKKNFKRYINEFNKLIISIKENGFDSTKSLIPLGKNMIILDGAHRLAIAYYFNQKVECLKFENFLDDYSYKFFEKNLLEEKYLDNSILEYAKLKRNVYILLIKDFNEFEDVIDINNVVYIKDVKLNSLFVKNIPFNIKKVDTLKMVVFETGNILKLKECIYKKKYNFVYFFDDNESSIEMLEMMLNENSFEFLSNVELESNLKIYKQINKIKKQINNQGLNKEDYVFISYELLGINNLERDHSLECISCNAKKIKSKLVESIICKNEKKLDDLIYDPNNYFYFNELKFLTLSNINKVNKLSWKSYLIIKLKLLRNFDYKKCYKNINFKIKILFRNFLERVKIIVKFIIRISRL